MTGPKRFRKRPVEVEAMQYTGANTEELMNFIGRKCKFATHPEPVVVIATLEGDMTAKFDDYIIKGVKREKIPLRF